MSIEMIAALNDGGRRLDRILRKTLPDLPLSRIHRLLRKGRVMLDGKPAQGAVRVTAGAVITILEDGLRTAQRLETLGGKHLPAGEGSALLPQQILWEGAGLLILNKPAGLVVHGPESLETMVQAYLADKIPPSLSFKPGPLHRLDRQTSGIIVFSASLEGARYFSALIRERQVKKGYLALVEGKLESPAVWEDGLIRDRDAHKTFIAEHEAPGAKDAGTRVFPLAVSASHSLIMAEICTGRTHQIRAQAAFHGHPLAGDKKYGGAPPGGLLLHAYTLEFKRAGTELPVMLKAPLPKTFSRRIKAIFGEKATKAYRGAEGPPRPPKSLWASRPL
jgi:23S rRNA pseudouridine955/2504/2580 synthase